MVLQHKAVSWTERDNTTLPGACETTQLYLITSLYDFLVSVFFYIIHRQINKKHIRARKF